MEFTKRSALLKDVPIQMTMGKGWNGGSMFMTFGGSAIKLGGKQVGQVNCTPSAGIVIEADGDVWFISPIELWKAFQAMREYTDVKQMREDGRKERELAEKVQRKSKRKRKN